MAVEVLRVGIFIGLLIICEGQSHGPFEDRYKGCYEDKDEDGRRALEILAYKVDGNGVNSNGICIRNCSGREYTFAGVNTRLQEQCYNTNTNKRSACKVEVLRLRPDRATRVVIVIRYNYNSSLTL
ncbi:hypothetical protein CAPTEDRAFT_189572 [Capitella teleta]|uniref:WSC domain-containing protein n=1 Tax=Capitella teleta TaxID=283909 RepID=R7UC12_CAPTE|nr:hypothetical protein CAPTEDRAFT_189572 [Capitella teleta]|eukprot:ELU03514.1 hypothetical protein CAPTEDRAFT_189572 [Capitella teleta]